MLHLYLPCSFLDARNACLGLADLQSMVLSLWRTVLATSHDLEVQVSRLPPDRCHPSQEAMPRSFVACIPHVRAALPNPSLQPPLLLPPPYGPSPPLPPQVRCAGTLTSALKLRKRELQVVLPWRPMYDLLLSLVADPPPRIDGEEGQRREAEGK